LLIIPPLIAFGRELIDLYAGGKYGQAAAVMSSILFVYPITWASAMFYRVSHAIGKVGAYYCCDIFVQVLMAATIYYFVAIRGMGAAGAGLAIGICGGLMHVVLIWPMGLRLIGGSWVRFFQQTVWPGCLPFFASLLFCFAFRQFIAVNSWSGLGAGAVAAASIYVGVLLAFCLDASERELIRRFAGRARTWFGRVAAVRSKSGVAAAPQVTP
jgi:hypothetical protein